MSYPGNHAFDLTEHARPLEHRLLQRDGAVRGAGIHLADQRVAHPVAELPDIAAEPRVPERLGQHQPDRLGALEIVLDRLDDRAEALEHLERRLARRRAPRRRACRCRETGARRCGCRRGRPRAAPPRRNRRVARPSECGSHLSGPAIACSISAVSITVRVIGVMCDWLPNPSGVRSCGTRPSVCLNPTTPQHAAGMRLDPPPSVPMPIGPSPAAYRRRGAAARPAAGARQIPRVRGAPEKRRLGKAFMAEFRGSSSCR
jgi:hypothetical protein